MVRWGWMEVYFGLVGMTGRFLRVDEGWEGR